MLLHKAQKGVVCATPTCCTAASKQLPITPNTCYVVCTFTCTGWLLYNFFLGSFNTRFPQNDTIIDHQVSKWIWGWCCKLLHMLSHTWLAQSNNRQLFALYTNTFSTKINHRLQSLQKSHTQNQRYFIVKYLKHSKVIANSKRYVQTNLSTCIQCAAISQLHIVLDITCKVQTKRLQKL